MYFLFHSSFYLLQTLPLYSCCLLWIKKTDLEGQEGKKGFGTWFAYNAIYLWLKTLFLSISWLKTLYLTFVAMVGKRTATSWAFELYQLRLYSFEIYLCQNDLDLFHQIRATILHIRLTCDYSTGSPNTKSHWVPSSHLTLETELTCLIRGRGAGAGAGAFLKFKSKNAHKPLLNAMSAKTCFAHSFVLCIYK